MVEVVCTLCRKRFDTLQELEVQVDVHELLLCRGHADF